MSSYGSNATPCSSSGRYATVADAAAQQSTEAVMEMLAQGYRVDGQDSLGNTALHWIAFFRLDTLISPVLEKRARPDIVNYSGESPVHFAAMSSHVAGLDAMTRANRALLSLHDKDGYTPFIVAAKQDNSPVMEWMYLQGVSTEEQDDDGRTALHWACYNGNKKTVQWLLSRSASIVHRDRDGMTAIHWAAMKGHELIADMLMEVGAVKLLDVPDRNGITPIEFAMRKKNRYLVASFHKSQVLNYLLGRPYVFRNSFANLFMCFIAFNIMVFAFIVAPGIAARNPEAVMHWSVLMGLSLLLWVQCCFSDPGCLRPPTIHPQHHLLGNDPEKTFDVEQPIESQMAHCDSVLQQLTLTCNGKDSEVIKLELQQNMYNYQRQVLREARKQLERRCGMGDPRSPAKGELQPLIAPGYKEHIAPQQAQLDRATETLHERERSAGENLGRARVEQLLAEGCGEYLSLVEKGEFKHVCIVCRARRAMRSHHCKEIGRCVDKMDHHCPWIDNCVGLGNQRSFYMFVLVLFTTILYFYYTVFLYVFDTVFPEISHGSFSELLQAMTSGSLAPELQPLVVLITAVFDLVWVYFVGLLVLRHTAYMLVNVTTYEVLMRPPHMQRRFPKARGKFFFFQGFGLMSALANCARYWMLDGSADVAMFFGRPQESFVAAEQVAKHKWEGGPDAVNLPEEP
ncbi:akr1, partial [Symbiodinium pilosum]